MEKEKLNEEYDLMDENQKFAMRYGAEGRHLSDVIRDNPEKITSPDKMLDAWDKGMNLRKNGTSKDFLDDIEKTERDNLLSSSSPKADKNGITAEPVRDMWGNDLSESSSFGNSEETSIPPKELKLDFGEDENYTPKGENYLLQPEENYDKMYLTNYSNEAPTGKTKDGKTHVTYGCEDENVVGGIQLRLNEMGYKGKSGAEIKITGTFDEDTEEGIKQFQKERGLPVTGIFDDATKKEMGFAEDYSIKRQGKNATPYNHPYSPPFNLEEYNKKQADKKGEKEDDEVNLITRLWGGFLGFLSDCMETSAQAIDEDRLKNKEDEEENLSYEIPEMYPGEGSDDYIRRIGS